MKELCRTNDAVYLSFAQAVLAAEGIRTFLLDANMSSVEGSLGALPRRLMVAESDFDRAARLLAEAEPQSQPGTEPEPEPESDS
jgi:hypothetical protein